MGRALPREFLARQQQLPLVYLPLGLCEPHGHAAAFGLDTLKAEWLCEEAARRFGGIVAPTQGYQIHETGYHRPWLAKVVGDVNPHLGSVPPDVLLRMLLFQCAPSSTPASAPSSCSPGTRQRGRPAPRRHRSDAHPAGADHRRRRPGAGPTGHHTGDHAGRFEISQLLYIRPDLVDLARLGDTATSPLGRFAQGADAGEATAEPGRASSNTASTCTSLAADDLSRSLTWPGTNWPGTGVAGDRVGRPGRSGSAGVEAIARGRRMLNPRCEPLLPGRRSGLAGHAAVT